MKQFHFALINSAKLGCYMLEFYIDGTCVWEGKFHSKEQAYERIGDLERSFDMEDYSFIDMYQI